MPFSLTIKGLEQLQAYTSNLATTLKPNITNKVSTAFQEGASRMRSDCPVRTGHLRSTITESGGNGSTILARIDITAEYAGFVNFGTHKMAPRPFASNGYNYIITKLKTTSFNK